MTDMKKALYIGTGLFIGIAILSIVGLLYLTWNQYDDTRQWEDSTFTGKLSDVPPELAKNYTNHDNKETIAIWAKVNESIDEIDKKGSITESTAKEYQIVLDNALQKQEEYKLQDGNVVKANAQLQLYLDIFSFTQKAYKTPDSETLQKLSGQLEMLMMRDTHSINEKLHTQLEEITTRYRALSSFIETTLPMLGTIDKGILTANIELDAEKTSAMTKEITDNDLVVFPHIKRLQKMLQTDTWSEILTRNKITQSYHKWQTEKVILETLRKSDYYNVDDIRTLQQAKDMGINTPEKEREGYTIDMNSTVTMLSYEGQSLKSNQYIKKGTPVIATVEVRYIPIPKEEEPVKKPENPVDKTEPPVVKPETPDTKPTPPVDKTEPDNDKKEPDKEQNKEEKEE